VALTLRLLGGLSTRQVASAFLVSEATNGGAAGACKRKIRAARILYRVPEAHQLPDRLRSVLAVVYLVYNAGRTKTAEPGLCTEAIRLARVDLDNYHRSTPREPICSGGWAATARPRAPTSVQPPSPQPTPNETSSGSAGERDQHHEASAPGDGLRAANQRNTPVWPSE
jgi:hypothetical protein